MSRLPFGARASEDCLPAAGAVSRACCGAPRVRESGWMMSTGAPCLMAHPAVAFAQLGVPDGYVAPHDSPAAYARAVEAARGRVAAR
jgi:hypothetical protein